MSTANQRGENHYIYVWRVWADSIHFLVRHFHLIWLAYLIYQMGAMMMGMYITCVLYKPICFKMLLSEK